MEMELRTFECELRAESSDDGSSSKIIGSAAVFDMRSNLLRTPWGEPFREVIKPGAFDGVMKDDVRALFNHDPNYVLARSKSGTLSLTVSDRSLDYEIDTPATRTIQDLVVAPMKRGDISQSSFAFRVASGGDDWDYDEDGVLVRTITKVSALLDVSPVTYPAYSQSESGLSTRSLDEFKKKGENNHELTELRKAQQANWRAQVNRTLETL